MTMNPKLRGLLAAAAMMSVAACGGGGGGDGMAAAAPAPAPAPAGDAIPTSASASVSGMLAYMKPMVERAVAAFDAMEPIDVSSFTPPTDDTVEPDPSV
jgi:serine protease